MDKQISLRPGASLLERASELFDFRREFGPEIPEAPQAPAAAPRDPEDADEPSVALSPAPAAEPTVAVEEPVHQEPEPQAAPLRRRSPPRGPVRIDRSQLVERGFIEPDGPITGLAEEFRIIKRQLLSGMAGADGGDEAKRRTILICSAQPDEGKTFAAINLALSMASEKDIDILLVDGDFANPEIPALLGLEAGPGLVDALAEGGDPEALVIRTDIPGLSVLPAGRHANDVTELLASERTGRVLDRLAAADRKRVIIFDSPPVLAASPATALAAYAGQIMMVVRADRTTDSDLKEALSLLSDCENIGLMLNRASPAVSGRRFGSYYGYGE